MTRPQVNQVTINDLIADVDFREFWAETLKGIRKFNMNEAMLVEIHKPKPRVGNIDAINSQAALDMHRLEGSLEVWETILNLNSVKVEVVEEEDQDDEGDTSL